MSSEEPAVVVRPDDDDYDLLTYGEVAARMSELVADEQRALADLREAGGGPEALEPLEARIAQLRAARDRYAEQSMTAETFLRRFGLTPRPRT